MQRVIILAIALSISGCTADTEDIIPQDGPTMSDTYNRALQSTGQGKETSLDHVRAAAAGQARVDDVQGYTRTAENEIDNLFPTLQNPDLVMFVFPHLTSGERLPVPGYATSFPLFERTEFALPGEAAAPPKEEKKPKIRIFTGKTGSPSIRTF